MNRTFYRPLPSFLAIAVSEVDGLGLFATELIRTDQCLGATHFEYGKWFIRTPLGGWINHSETPNIERRREGEWWVAYALQDIEPGEEIFLRYTLYTLESINDKM